MTHPNLPDQWETGKLIETTREKIGMSRRSAARLAGISESWWRKLETGYVIREGKITTVNPTPEALAKVADVIRIPTSKLLSSAGFNPDEVLVGSRQIAHDMIDGIDAKHLPAVIAFLKGLSYGLNNR